MAVITTSNFKTVNFYQMPKALINNLKYKNISSNAKLAYMILRDKLSLSIKENWIEKDGRIFVKLSRQSLMEYMNVSINTATKIFKELVESELIVEEATNVKKIAKKIYVCEVEGEVRTKSKEHEEEVDKNESEEVEKEIIEAVQTETGLTNEESRELLKLSNNNIKEVLKYYRYTLKQKDVKNIFNYTRMCIIKKFKIPEDIRNIKGTFNRYEQRKYDFEKLENALFGECSLSEAII